MTHISIGTSKTKSTHPLTTTTQKTTFGTMFMRLGLCVVMLAVLAAAVTVKELEQKVEQLSRQLMLQQLFVEERIRSDGSSGLKQVRLQQQGTLPYHTSTVTGQRVAAVHDHSNHYRTVGLGEFAAVLNGVEFRTRHNDYKVVMSEEQALPHERIEYNKVRDIPFPDVPPEVTRKRSIRGQIREMRKWFKAWRDQDYSERDYRKYFKPILCYLEGGWTISSSDTIDESFDSDRHFIDAESWLDLQEKVRFTSTTGRKDSSENYAYLPTTIMTVDNGTNTMAQWNYRILCHPLRRDLSTKRLTLIDDVTSRIAFGRTMENHRRSRAARFRVAPLDEDIWTERIINYDLLDELMAQIPGKDGYGNTLRDEGLDGITASAFKSNAPLDAGYYHRWFTAAKDAMGTENQHRGFADENLFMARTTQPKIAPIWVEKCTGKHRRKTCSKNSQRWTYAIPMEVIYLTPLQRWNPYNIKYKGAKRSPEAKTVTANGRTGREEAKALNGSHQTLFYHTPAAFYAPLKDSGDAADTAGKSLWVLDSNDEPQQTVASGVRIHIPEIVGVGELRMRYPIMPFSYEGSAAWKELTALKDIVLQPKRYSHMFYTDKDDDNDIIQDDSIQDEPTMVSLKLKTSRSSDVEPHEHVALVPLMDLAELAANPNGSLHVSTDQSNGHTHTLTLKVGREENGREFIYYAWCGTARICWDDHPKSLKILDV